MQKYIRLKKTIEIEGFTLQSYRIYRVCSITEEGYLLAFPYSFLSGIPFEMTEEVSVCEAFQDYLNNHFGLACLIEIFLLLVFGGWYILFLDFIPPIFRIARAILLIFMMIQITVFYWSSTQDKIRYF